MSLFLSLTQFLVVESSLKMMKITFYFMLKALSDLNVFKYLSRLFSHVGQQLNKKAKANFKNYDVTDWQTNNYNTHIVQCPKK